MYMYVGIISIYDLRFTTPLPLYFTPPMRGINERSMIIYTNVWWFVVQIFILLFVSLKDEKFHRKLKSPTKYQDGHFPTVISQLNHRISPNFVKIREFEHFRLFPYIMLLNRCCKIKFVFRDVVLGHERIA